MDITPVPSQDLEVAIFFSTFFTSYAKMLSSMRDAFIFLSCARKASLPETSGDGKMAKYVELQPYGPDFVWGAR